MVYLICQLTKDIP